MMRGSMPAQVLRRQAEALCGEVQHFVVGIRT
jgi:hypothetical protein